MTDSSYDTRVFNNRGARARQAVTENQPHTSTKDEKFYLDLRVEYLPLSKEEKEQVRRDTDPYIEPTKSWAARIPPKYKAPFSRIGRGGWVVSPNSLDFYIQETPDNVDLIIPDEWIGTCDLMEMTSTGEMLALIHNGVVKWTGNPS